MLWGNPHGDGVKTVTQPSVYVSLCIHPNLFCALVSMLHVYTHFCFYLCIFFSLTRCFWDGVQKTKSYQGNKWQLPLISCWDTHVNYPLDVFFLLFLLILISPLLGRHSQNHFSYRSRSLAIFLYPPPSPKGVYESMCLPRVSISSSLILVVLIIFFSLSFPSRFFRRSTGIAFRPERPKDSISYGREKKEERESDGETARNRARNILRVYERNMSFDPKPRSALPQYKSGNPSLRVHTHTMRRVNNEIRAYIYVEEIIHGRKRVEEMALRAKRTRERERERAGVMESPCGHTTH